MFKVAGVCFVAQEIYGIEKKKGDAGHSVSVFVGAKFAVLDGHQLQC